MTRSSPPQLSFSSGEISPLLYGRPDYLRTQTGLEKCRGFIPLRQGGVTRAPGTEYRGNTSGDQDAVLIPFIFAQNDAAVLEFTHQKMRVWRYGVLVQSGAQPFEMATPYTLDDLQNLQWRQSADVIYIADGRQPIQRLARMALDDWSINPFTPNDGPFRNENIDETKTIRASGIIGNSISLIGTGDVFSADMVGTLLRLDVVSNTRVPLWTGNQEIEIGEKRRFDGNIYELVAGANTKVNPPIHLEGDQNYDGDEGLVWRFLGTSVGIVRIRNYTNPNSVIAEIIKTVPEELYFTPTYRWSEGAWSERFGYPAAIELFDQRLVAAATRSDPRTVWFSAVGGFDVFEPSVEADGSFAYSIAGGETQNRITWLRTGKRGLHIGALGEEYVTRSTDPGQVIGPLTTEFALDSTYGSKNVRPIAPDGRPMFITRDGKRLIELSYAFESDANVPRELSLPAEHIGQMGFESIVWQSSPVRLAWLEMSGGDLAVMVLDQAEDVLGWATYPLAGGRVVSMAITPDASGTSDILTLAVARDINGETKTFIEQQSDFFGLLTGNTPIKDANHLFAATRFVGEETTFQVPHLAGRIVRAWTDQGEFPDLEVSAQGTVTLQVAVEQATIGLYDPTAKARAMDIQAPARDGSSIGRRKKINPGTAVRVHNTAAGVLRFLTRDVPQAEIDNGQYELIDIAVAAGPDQAFSGLVQLPAVTEPAREIRWEIEPKGGAPLTFLGVIPRIEEVGA